MNYRIKTILASSAVLGTYANVNAAVSLEIAGVQSQIVGTAGAAVPGSGSTANFVATTTTGDFAVFDINETTGGGTTDYGELKVTYLVDNASAGSSIMIARTVDSQGLTDAGTLSVLIFNREDLGTVTLEFEWYEPGSFVGGVEQGGATLKTDAIRYTTFDIDFNQIVSMPTLQVDTLSFFGATQLSAATVGADTVVTDSGAATVVDDPTTAVSFLTATGGTHQVSVGKDSANGFALFMFEFRDESEVVPEPSVALLGLLGLGFVMVRRRR